MFLCGVFSVFVLFAFYGSLVKNYTANEQILFITLIVFWAKTFIWNGIGRFYSQNEGNTPPEDQI